MKHSRQTEKDLFHSTVKFELNSAQDDVLQVAIRSLYRLDYINTVEQWSESSQ